MPTVQTNIRLDKDLREWYDKKAKEDDRDASYFMKKALIKFRDEFECGKNLIPAKQKTNLVKKFIKPSIQEASAYFYEKGSVSCNDDAQEFIDFYESKGWLVGKSPMKNWKAAINNWIKNSKKGLPRNLINKNDTRNLTIEHQLSDRSWAD